MPDHQKRRQGRKKSEARNKQQRNHMPHRDPVANQDQGDEAANHQAAAASSVPSASVATLPTSKSEKREGIRVSKKEMNRLKTKLAVEADEIQELANWSANQAQWSTFTDSPENFAYWQEHLNLSDGEELSKFVNDQPMSMDLAKEFVQFTRRRNEAANTGTPEHTKETRPRSTVSDVEKRWSGLHAGGDYLSVSAGEVAHSRSGSGMALLKGLRVNTGDGIENAHISVPPSDKGDGSWNEGHLKIESGHFRGDYFFNVDEQGKIKQLDNSATVPTRQPGQWHQLPKAVWSNLQGVIGELAYV